MPKTNLAAVSAESPAHREDEGTAAHIALLLRLMAIFRSGDRFRMRSEAKRRANAVRSNVADGRSNRIRFRIGRIAMIESAGERGMRDRRDRGSTLCRRPAETAGISFTRRRLREPFAGTEERVSANAFLSNRIFGVRICPAVGVAI